MYTTSGVHSEKRYLQILKAGINRLIVYLKRTPGSIVKRFLFNTYTDRYKPTVEDLFCKEFDLDTMTLKEVPIVVVGNKLDLSEDRRQVSKEDVAEWLFCELPRLRAKFMECSAKDNVNIREVFRAFLQLGRIPLASEQAPALQRRCSARVTGLRTRGFSSTSLQRDQSSSTGGGESSLQKSTSGSTALDGFGVQKAKPRSRSLIRRTSKKAKLKDPAAGDDCTVS
ncbi:conserved hypothetical protein [Ixodes scapularis]|uniref:GTP-binding protein Di-Ras2 n=1 Tax=Ixodes scapularis TaxID=6945 RepID=B7P838_IXOSC|nr:conserved hypothetical protein [Ixodes scapularis]|eukprot:XP_002400969.1 conserved hypothetical protein [Ixodes scapularis]